MNLDFGAMLKLRGAWQRFNENHPRAVEFGNEVYANTIFCGFDGTKTACKAIIAGEVLNRKY